MQWFRNIILKVYEWIDWFKQHKLDLTYDGLIYHLKEVFKRPEIIKEEDNTPIILEVEDDDGITLDKDPSRNSLIKVFDYNIFPDPVIEGKGNVLGLLIVDDAAMTKYLYDSDFRKIKREKNKDVLEDFKVYNAYGDKCGYIGYKSLLNIHYNISYAVLDITLGFPIKHESGLCLEIDGVDLAIKMLSKNPDARFIFISAHTLNIRNPIMKKYIEKFNDITGLNMKDYYVNKSDTTTISRYQAIYELLYGDKYGKHKS